MIVLDAKIPTELMHAVFTKDIPKIRKLLAEGKTPIDDSDGEGYTALHYAALHGQKEITTLLLEANADPRCKNKDKKKPFDLALEKGQVEIMVMLEKAEKALPLIKPEEMPGRIVELENTVEQLRKQMAAMLEVQKPKAVKKKFRPLKPRPRH